MELDFVSCLLGVLIATGAFSGLIVRDAMRPQGRTSSNRNKHL